MNPKEGINIAKQIVGIDAYKREFKRDGSRHRAVLFGLIQAVAPVNYEASPPNRETDTSRNRTELIDKVVEGISFYPYITGFSYVASEGDIKGVAIFVAGKTLYNVVANKRYNPGMKSE